MAQLKRASSSRCSVMEREPRDVGAATDGVELKFTPQSEILVRSPGLLKEYHRAPISTRQARNAEGWFHTGDAGSSGMTVDAVIDRITNIGALTDGTPYAPRRLENRLKIFPYIKEAVVFGNGRDRVCARRHRHRGSGPVGRQEEYLVHRPHRLGFARRSL